MPITLAFDVYGTLIDTHGVVAMLGEMIGDKAGEFSTRWREKQLEYAFRRGLMQTYKDFAVCTSQALDYTCAAYDIGLTDRQKQDLLELYRTLPAFDDVQGGLKDLREAGFRLYAFSNGSAQAVEQLLEAAAIRQYFLAVISVNEIGSFKPDPAVYHHFLQQSGAVANNAWLVSSNPFDVIGAVSSGMRAAWLKRSRQAVFDPWGIEPTITVAGFHELREYMLENLSE